MHVIEITTPGGPDVLKWAERPMPKMAADEVLIKVAAAGVNRADLLQRQGHYPPPEDAGDILGMEVAGEIVATGAKATRWKIGDKVCALLSGGGYAEYAVAPAAQCLPVPKNLSLIEAAALPECIVTVWANVFEDCAATVICGQEKPRLCMAAHSGIGTTAIQMVNKLLARKFLSRLAARKNAEACRKLGADLAINYKKEDFPVAAIERENRKNSGVDVVLDMVGGDYVARNLSVGSHPKAVPCEHRGAGWLQERDRWISGTSCAKVLVLTGSTLRASRSREEKARLVPRSRS